MVATNYNPKESEEKWYKYWMGPVCVRSLRSQFLNSIKNLYICAHNQHRLVWRHIELSEALCFLVDGNLRNF